MVLFLLSWCLSLSSRKCAILLVSCMGMVNPNPTLTLTLEESAIVVVLGMVNPNPNPNPRGKARFSLFCARA